MDKQNVEYYAALKRGQNFDTCYNMDEPQKHYTKWKKWDMKEQILYDSTYTANS